MTTKTAIDPAAVRAWLDENLDPDGVESIDPVGLDAPALQGLIREVVQAPGKMSEADVNALHEAYPSADEFQSVFLAEVVDVMHIEKELAALEALDPSTPQMSDAEINEILETGTDSAAAVTEAMEKANRETTRQRIEDRQAASEHGIQDVSRFQGELDTLRIRDAARQHIEKEKRQANAGRVVRRTLAEFTPVAPAFLWEGVIPVRGLTLATGEGGAMKSSGLRKLAAELTQGTLPGKFAGKPSGVMYIAGEEDVPGFVYSSFLQAGADMSRVHVWAKEDADGNVSTKNFDAAQDMTELKSWCLAEDIRLVVVDPITQFFGDAEINAQNETRAALMPWTKLSEEISGSVVGIAHTNKSRSGDMAHDVSGSAALTQVARTVLGFAMDDLGGVMSVVKSNVGAKPSYEYSMRLDTVDMLDEFGDQTTFDIPVFVLGAQTSVTAGEVQTGQRMKDSEKAAQAVPESYAGPGSRLVAELYDYAVNRLGTLHPWEIKDEWEDSAEFKKQHAKELFPTKTTFIEWAMKQAEVGLHLAREEVLPWLESHDYISLVQTGGSKASPRHAVIPLLSKENTSWSGAVEGLKGLRSAN